jgi:hypothetical protein
MTAGEDNQFGDEKDLIGALLDDEDYQQNDAKK